jgi:hypothetical protein
MTTLDADGVACLWSPVDVTVVIDVQAELSATAEHSFALVDPIRVYDGRTGS